ncbi:hypothetical protein TRFO_42709 [Tritrichomonas foetus]|uniref:Uncharacterized protein n=1 Tax=Tritrichomonas foetus TaxID=1144522 RepID=A0A1J4KVF5_9EUKA|nr:hypothetical protein TRFO_42709 [Tritrichomonas foetus]|eukprot:OHT15130.1 hypothetical protein TRFO_42709 [Tritrichomonas foetus]
MQQSEILRQQFIKNVVPLIPQLTGERRVSKMRNIALVDPKWFADFSDWILNSPNGKEPPGPITNNELYQKLQVGLTVQEFKDFELVEENVFEVLMTCFKGGPLILRPYMTHPTTNETTVLLTPLKINVLADGNRFTRTVDPKWTIQELNIFLANKMGYDPNQTKLRFEPTNEILPIDATVDDVSKKLGIDLVLDVPIITNGSNVSSNNSYTRNTMGIIPNNTHHSATSKSLCTISPSFSNSDHSLSSANSQPGKFFHSSVLSVVNSFVFSLAKNSLILQRLASIDQSAIDTDSSTYHFIQYAKAVGDHSNMIVPSTAFFSSLAKGHEFSSFRYFEPQNIIQNIISSIDEKLPENAKIAPLMNITIKKTRECSKCNEKVVTVEEIPCIQLDIPSKSPLFRKTSIQDCIHAFLSTKKKSISDFETCQNCRESTDLENKVEKQLKCTKCSKITSKKETIEILNLPKLFVLSLTRFIQDKSSINKRTTDVVYPLNMSLDKFCKNSECSYNLMGVIAHSGKTVNQKCKLFLNDLKARNWKFYNENKTISTDAKAALIPCSALMLLYQMSNE